MSSPTGSSPRSSAPRPGGGAPTSVRIAAGLLALLAVLLLLSAGLTLAGRDIVVDRFLAAQPDLDRGEVERAVVVGQVRYLLVAAASVVAIAFLLRRRSWARWLGVLAALSLGLLTVLSVLSAGGTTVFSLLVVVLCAGAVSSLLARSTADWAPSRSRGGARP